MPTAIVQSTGTPTDELLTGIWASFRYDQPYSALDSRGFFFRELVKSQTGSYVSGVRRLHRRFLVNHRHVDDLVEYLVGASRLVTPTSISTGSSGGYSGYYVDPPSGTGTIINNTITEVPPASTPFLVRHLPDRYVGSNGIQLYCTDVDDISPFKPTGKGGPLSDQGEYSVAQVSATYQTINYDVYPSDGVYDYANGGRVDESRLTRFVSKEPQPSVEFQHLPFGGFKWVREPGTAEPENVQLIGSTPWVVPRVDYRYTWHRVPAIPDSARYLIGCVNATNFAGKAPGTMQYVACRITRYVGPHGIKQYDIEYLFRFFSAMDYTQKTKIVPYNPERGHNFFIRVKPGTNTDPYKIFGYRMLTDTGLAPTPNAPGGTSSLPVYRETELRDLFRYTAFNGGFEHA